MTRNFAAPDKYSPGQLVSPESSTRLTWLVSQESVIIEASCKEGTEKSVGERKIGNGLILITDGRPDGC